ncbi:phasin family protein [Massilia sp. G4R7]|uniref:Phasin family protein n=1 Tax=Massilia phyllostachyos TaxID=2898585 RepID=A0ABS8QD02_9BURK|nr:phasin family protein [Massilia phyllostachyos]MCD2519638.1 phasin family protein [Massilia phyllostachyos]
MEPKLKEALEPEEHALLDAVCASAHRIWQAGLGAFARAQREGGELFDKLLQDGGELQKLTQRLGSEQRSSVTDTVTRLAENASRQAGGSLDKLEKLFEERVARSMRSMGLPSPEETRGLGREVTELRQALQAAGKHTQDEIDSLKRDIAALRTAAGAAPAKKAQRPAAKVAVRAPAKAAAKRPAAKRAARPDAR